MWALARAGCRLPRLQVCHAFAFEEYMTRYGLDWGWGHAAAAATTRRIEARLYRGAARLLVLSAHMRQRLDEAFAIRTGVSVVAGGSDAVDDALFAARRSLRAEFGWQGPVVVSLLGVDKYLTQQGIDYQSLLVFAAVIGFGGAFISLLMSKPIAKWSTGAHLIDGSEGPAEAWLVQRALQRHHGNLQRAADEAQHHQQEQRGLRLAAVVHVVYGEGRAHSRRGCAGRGDQAVGAAHGCGHDAEGNDAEDAGQGALPLPT